MNNSSLKVTGKSGRGLVLRFFNFYFVDFVFFVIFFIILFLLKRYSLKIVVFDLKMQVFFSKVVGVLAAT